MCTSRILAAIAPVQVRPGVLCLFLTIVLCSLLIPSTKAFGKQIGLQWDPSRKPVDGYKLYYGFSKGKYVSSVDVGNVTHYDFDAKATCRTYYFAVTAYDVYQGIESSYSNEVSAATYCPRTMIGIGQPLSGGTVEWPLRISGFAVDPAAPNGTGVDLIHIWAHPHDGSAPFFLAGATPNINRPDVVSFLGDRRFEPSGFRVEIKKLLPEGDYTLRIYARSEVTGTFASFRDVPVTVAGTLIVLNRPRGNASVAVPFEISGWAVHRSATVGTGIDEVHVWAYPSGGGSAMFLGAAAVGLSRPDVARALGVSHYVLSGFRLQVKKTMRDGLYMLRIYARDAVTGKFDPVGFRQVAVKVGSDLRVAVLSPRNGEILPASFTIKGWALDLAASSGTGVDRVHVWAFPEYERAPFFVGAANLGIRRPDVAAFFRNNQFLDSGFKMDVTAPFAPGRYELRVYAHSIISGAFSRYKSVSITVP